MEEQLKNFKDYLDANGYRSKYLVDNYQNEKIGSDRWHRRINVKNGEKTVQAFVIMDESERENCPKYPFYNSYRQLAAKNHDVLPACFIASYKDGNWRIYNASAPDVPVDNQQEIINYKKACKRFARRWRCVPEVRMVIWSRIVCWSVAAFLSLWLLLTSFLDISILACMKGQTLNVMILIIVMLLLPIILPCVNSISLSGNGVGVSKED